MYVVSCSCSKAVRCCTTRRRSASLWWSARLHMLTRYGICVPPGSIGRHRHHSFISIMAYWRFQHLLTLAMICLQLLSTSCAVDVRACPLCENFYMLRFLLPRAARPPPASADSDRDVGVCARMCRQAPRLHQQARAARGVVSTCMCGQCAYRHACRRPAGSQTAKRRPLQQYSPGTCCQQV
jgi:hypothetical protein